MDVDFTLKKSAYRPIYINNTPIPHYNGTKHLGITLEDKLRWKEHVQKKELDI